MRCMLIMSLYSVYRIVFGFVPEMYHELYAGKAWMV